MEQNSAAEHLQVIRTLMERAAIYRRTLAPVMIFAGIVGTAAAAGGWVMSSMVGFVLFWYGVAAFTLIGSLLLIRSQALKDREPFWSPPARRVAQAMLPALTAGLLVGLLFLFVWSEKPTTDPPTGIADDAGPGVWLVGIWAIFYGCALHAAGFFASRGLRLFGWLYIAAGTGIWCWLLVMHQQDQPDAAWPHCHWLMGCLFGVSHLAYGVYLHFTEKGKTAT